MALFVQKPIFWNTRKYFTPSGGIAASGYPKETGYGHEEWNNSPRMHLSRGRQQYRIFHTEGLGSAALDENAGQTFVFMTVSHDGIQQLVGIAGNAAGMMSDDYREQRLKIAAELSLVDLWTDAWDVSNVQKQYGHDKEQFKRDWNLNLHWIPNWICPDDLYWWLDEPVTLDSQAITGRGRLLGMFGSYTKLDMPTVFRLLEAIPVEQRQRKWQLLSDAIRCAPAEPLAVEDMFNGSESVTTVLTKVNARRGQGRFRQDLMKVWEGACAVTGLDCREALKASHVKPWAASTNKQRLDSNNGLLLSANLDALFDAGLITFDSNGQMHISSRLDAKHRAALGIPKPLRIAPTDALKTYLSYHREIVFQR